MSDPNLVPEGWAGPATFLTAAGALLASVFRKGVSKHYVANAVNPVANRVSILEAQHEESQRVRAEINRRLDRIETKLDRALDRR